MARWVAADSTAAVAGITTAVSREPSLSEPHLNSKITSGSKVRTEQGLCELKTRPILDRTADICMFCNM